MRTILPTLLLFSFTCIFATSFFPTTGNAQEMDWWAVKNDVGLRLNSGEIDLLDWASELSESEPATVEEAVVKANIMMRVGLNDETVAALQSLKSMQAEGESPTNYLISNIYYEATDEYEAWDVAAKVAEIFDADIQEMSIGNRLIRHWEDHGILDADEIDAWLIERIKNAVAAEEDGLTHEQQQRYRMFGRTTPAQSWRTLRLRFLMKQGRAEALLQELEQEVRDNPADSEKAKIYLEMLNLGLDTAEARNSLDLAWMLDLCRIDRATDASHLGQRFEQLQRWHESVAMYRLAYATKVTDEEMEEVAMTCSAMLPRSTHLLHYKVNVMDSLARNLLYIGETEEAQRVMVEATDIREEHGLGLNPYLAGMVQSASGAREIEGRIQEREELSQDDPKYWMERAAYYRGRANEQNEEERALLRALELCEPAPRPQGKLRAQAISLYARLLQTNNREAEAVMLLLAELRDVPIDSESSEAAARFLAVEIPEFIDPEESIYWEWLGRRPTWEHIEERLLWRMLENSIERIIRSQNHRSVVLENDPILAKFEAAFAKPEAMIVDQHPSRAAILGWVMNRMRNAERSIPVLKYAIEHAGEDEDLKGRASFTLFESYLDIGDWRSAEATYSDAAKRLTAHEQPDWRTNLRMRIASGVVQRI